MSGERSFAWRHARQHLESHSVRIANFTQVALISATPPSIDQTAWRSARLLTFAAPAT